MQRVLFLYGQAEATDNPLALEYIRLHCHADAVLRENFHFEILSLPRGGSAGWAAQQVLETSPSVVAASCYVWNTNLLLDVCRLVKAAQPSVIVLLGGPDVGHNAYEIVWQNPWVDYVVSGEGEDVFCEFLKGVFHNEPPARIHGLTRRDEIAVRCAERPGCIELSGLPLMFHDENKGYLSSLQGKVVYETQRGCPRCCFFCACGSEARGRMRLFPLSRISAEINFLLASQEVHHLYLADSALNADENHAKAVLGIINQTRKRYGWEGMLSFHLDLGKQLPDDLVGPIIESRAAVGIGVQSLNPTTLKRMGRAWFDRRVFELNLRLLETKIRLVFQFIYGCPGDTYETFRQGLAWAVEADRDVWFDRLCVLPGTVYRRASNRFGLIFEHARPNYVVTCDTFSPGDLQLAESLHRGFLIYHLRNLFDIDKMARFLSVDRMALLEGFGRWCTTFVPQQSLEYVRLSARKLPQDFVGTLTRWVGGFIKSASHEHGLYSSWGHAKSFANHESDDRRCSHDAQFAKGGRP